MESRKKVKKENTRVTVYCILIFGLKVTTV